MDADFLYEPETEILLKSMLGNSRKSTDNLDDYSQLESRLQMPFFVEGVSFNLSFVYQWIYLWGLDLPRLATFLGVSEESLANDIKKFVDSIKEKLDANPIGETEKLPHPIASHPPLPDGGISVPMPSRTDESGFHL